VLLLFFILLGEPIKEPEEFILIFPDGTIINTADIMEEEDVFVSVGTGLPLVRA
jgi:hypothetical protein